MELSITPGKLKGSIVAISSKSYLHRILICAALADKETVIRLNCRSRDVDATVRCLQALGAEIREEKKSLVVKPIAEFADASPELACGESGSTARFMLPLAAAVCGGGTLTGEGRLPERPFGEICKCLAENGCPTSAENLPITVGGRLKAGTYAIPANVSSQYISALMMSLPLVEGDSEIVFTTPAESVGYLDITRAVMKDFGLEIEKTANGYKIAGGRRYVSPGEITAEGDWSNGAFWAAANAMGSEIIIDNLKEDSIQGDRVAGMLAEKIMADRRLTVIDGSNIPDLVPILAIVACARKGYTRFTNCGRLRLKESDRLETVKAMIRSLGGEAWIYQDDLIIHSLGRLIGGKVDCCNDHRIAMAAGIASTVCGGPVKVIGAECAAKSYPDFFADLERLGGKVNPSQLPIVEEEPEETPAPAEEAPAPVEETAAPAEEVTSEAADVTPVEEKAEPAAPAEEETPAEETAEEGNEAAGEEGVASKKEEE